MHRIKKAPNPARKSGYRPSEVSGALKNFGNSGQSRQVDYNKPLKAKTKEEFLRLKAAGYAVVLDS